MLRISRRTALKGLGTLALSATAARGGLAAPALHKGTTITISTWGGEVEDSIKKYLEPEFTKQSGATLAYDIGSMGGRYAKLLAQRAAPQTDVFFCTDEAVVSGLKVGVLTTATRKNLPNLADVEKASLTLDAAAPADQLAAMPYCIIAYGLAYNTETMKDAPTSWGDLWKPGMEGKYSFAAVTHSMMPGIIITLAEMFGGSEKNVEPAFKKLAELRPAKLGFSWTDWGSLFKSGEIVMATEFDSYTASMKNLGYPIGYVLPKEKALGTIDVATVVKGTRSQELSELFLDLIADKNVQAGMVADSFITPINTKTVLSADAKAKCFCGGLNQPSMLRYFDPIMFASVRAAWTERLNTEVVPNWRTR